MTHFIFLFMMLYCWPYHKQSLVHDTNIHGTHSYDPCWLSISAQFCNLHRAKSATKYSIESLLHAMNIIPLTTINFNRANLQWMYRKNFCNYAVLQLFYKWPYLFTKVSDMKEIHDKDYFPIQTCTRVPYNMEAMNLLAPISHLGGL